MRRWLGIGAGLLVLLAALWFARPSPDSSVSGSGATPGQTGEGVPVPRSLPVNTLHTAPVPPARGALAIRGTVMGPDGPVAGAVVVATAPEPHETLSELPCQCDNHCGMKLLQCGCGMAAMQLVELVAERRGEAPPQARATTDAEGRFTLEGLEAGAYAVWADDSRGVGLREDVAAGTDGVEVRLGDGITLTGAALSEEGGPVAGALVTALFVTHSRFFDVLTDAEGRFRVGPLPPGDYNVVFARADLLPEHEKVRGGFTEALEVMMYRPRRLAGVVVRQGVPVAGARIHAEGEHRKLDAVTDGSGRFAFDGLRPGAYAVSASHEGQDAVAHARLEVRAEPPEVELSLGSAVTVRGMVRDTRGQPVPGASVSIWVETPRSGGGWVRVKSGADGTYTLGPVRPGEYRVHASAPRFLPLKPEARNMDGVTPVDLTLVDALVVEGRVVDAAGAPVKGAWLALRKEGGQGEVDDDFMLSDEPETSRARVSSEADGSFALDAPEAGPWHLTATHPEHVTVELPVSAPRKGLRLVLGAGGGLTGEVVDAKGAPVAEAYVMLLPAGAAEGTDSYKSAASDAQGRFALRGLVEGPYDLVARVHSRSERRGVARSIEVRGTATQHVRLQFPEGLSVSGLVVDTEGRPLEAAVHVEADEEEVRRESRRRGRLVQSMLRSRREVVSGADGRFTVRHLEPGGYRIWALLDGYVESEETRLVQAGAADVRLVLRRMPAIRGRVVREDGSPVTRFQLDGETRKDPRGAFSRPVHEDAELTLTFTANGLAGTSRTVQVKEGEDLDLGAVVLKKGREVRGRVTDGGTGAPVAGALVDVGEVPEDWARPAYLSERNGAVRTRSDGTFTLPHVEDRPLALVVVHLDYPQKRIPLGASEQNVTVVLDPGATVRGTVRGGESLPVSVRFQSRDGVYTDLAPVRDGAFEQKGVPAGDYVLTPRLSSQREDSPVFPSRRVRVPAEGTVTVDFEPLQGGATLRLRVAGEEDVFFFVVPGQVGMPSWEGAFVEATMLGHPSEADGPGGAAFRRVPPGLHTVFVLRSSERRGLEILREELTVPAEGEVSRELVPRWVHLPLKDPAEYVSE